MQRDPAGAVAPAFAQAQYGGNAAGMEKGLGTEVADEDYVDFFVMGAVVVGQFRCSECGYGVAVCRELPRCPMCGGESWEQAAWSPFGRAGAALRH